MTHRELRELVLLYSQISTDLASAREDATGRSMSSYLDQLPDGAHNMLHSTRASHPEGILLVDCVCARDSRRSCCASRCFLGKRTGR